MSLQTFLRTFLLLATLAALLVSSEASASSGYLQGTLRFHQKNGNYCPTGSACTGARYPQSNWDQQVGIPEAIVRLETTGGSLIASTVTDSAGNYALSWSYDSNGSTAGMGTADVSASVELVYYHKDSAFQYRSFANVGSKVQYVSTTPVTLDHGTTQASPQTHSKTWGTSANPGQIANSYWAAYMAYHYMLDDLARFTNVEIMAFEPVTPTPPCSTSCARGYPVNQITGRQPYEDQRLTVILDGDPGTAYWPLQRTMHELGHIGDFVSVQGGAFRTTLLNRDEPGANPGTWSLTSQEYRPTALTEGMGMFIGVAGFYADSATDPRICQADGNSPIADQRHCYSAASIVPYKIEESHAGTCTTLEGREPGSAMRYMWDVYDQAVDGSDNVDVSSATILTAMSKFPCSSYPNCLGDGDLFDQYSSMASTILGVTGSTPSSTELDDGNGWHWRDALVGGGGPDVTNAFTRNCMGYW